ncbi:xanthine dehydrogenase family protein molybdopterin-binding subunit [Aromatoleum toluclasticum]|uniref:xanthine dehydrogenase family protein molybdopterin-binding subunit n=1 Tax=Aromatoleum toluclasticum TaxID=92003 RepID=UPI001D18CDE8|nr:xanthine dehydrogenase family protein molybdopterin-binding subunit [Aromatoleum toluclasticum]MCC4118467.1 xanthine dehydrogenase family protein molybdopterin-binding subunit [Aromatoleum toluclasticum]
MSERYIPNVEVPAPRRHEAPRSDMRWIGKSMKRVEDPKLLTGRGKYIADIMLPGMAHAALLRSPFAHARIKAIDVSKARALPGVLAVVTGRELAERTGPTVTFANPPVIQHVIAIDRVRHVGETVAAVVAEDRYIAEDALELIEVDYEELPVVSDMEQARHATGDAVLHPERGDTNVASDGTFTFGPVGDDFARADVVVKRRLRWNRSAAQPLDTVGAVAEYDPGTGKFTVHCNTNMVNYTAWLCAESLGVPTTHLNVVPVLVGGSFGSKQILHKAIVLTASLSRIVGQPVKFIEDRLDNMTNHDAHGSDRVYEAELALKRDGTMLSLRYQVIDDYGAYFQMGIGTHGNTFATVTGPYRINSVEARVIAVLTNKAQQGPWRGFGAEVSNFVLERLVDAAAHELGIDPVELRRRNLIRSDEFPYVIPTGNAYDSGDYQAALAKALEMFDYDGWRAKQAEGRKQGRHIGIGFVTCQERSVYSATEFWFLDPLNRPGFQMSSSPESVLMKIDPTGKVFVKLNAPFWGQSPETVVTQIVAEALTVEPADIVTSFADQATGFNSVGPGGSRYTTMVAGACVKAVRTLKAKLFRLVAHMLECQESDLELHNGKVGIKGDPERAKTIAEIALQSHYFRLSFPDDPAFASGLETTAVYDHPLTTLPAPDRSHVGIFYPMMGHMVHAVAVEVDAQTGKVGILDYVAVHDHGTMVNPMTVDGQIRGGIAQGIGTALYEHFHYDENGQLLTASFADYHMPTVMEIPAEVRIGHLQTPSPYTEYGIKGGGEGGRMATPSVLAQAVEDALAPFGAEFMEVPLTPNRIRRILRGASRTSA